MSSLRQHRLVDAGAERQPLSGQVETPKRRKAAVRKVEVTRSAPTSKREIGLEGALCLLDRLTFDLEGLVTATRQEAHRTPPGKGAPGTEINPSTHS